VRHPDEGNPPLNDGNLWVLVVFVAIIFALCWLASR
jgi:hypothetical protein